MSELGYHEPQVLLAGYLTKRGHIRKNWKNRHFELTDDLRLSYYSTTGHRKRAGMMDLRFCTQIIPGGTCKIKWYSGADPHCCFGIMTSKKRLYVYCNTREDTKKWLEELRKALPPSVPVTTLEEIASSFHSVLPDDEETDAAAPRVTIFPNASVAGGKVIRLQPTEERFLEEASKALGFKACKIFFPTGADVYDFSLIKDNGVVIIAGGSNLNFKRHEGAVWANIRQSDNGGNDSDNDDGGDEDLSYEGMLAELEQEANTLKRHLSVRAAKPPANLSDGILDDIAETGEDGSSDLMGAAQQANPHADDDLDDLYNHLDDALDGANEAEAYITLEEIRSRMAANNSSGKEETFELDEDDREDAAYLQTSDLRDNDDDAGYMDMGAVREMREQQRKNSTTDGDDAPLSSEDADNGYLNPQEMQAEKDGALPLTQEDESVGYLDLGEVRKLSSHAQLQDSDGDSDDDSDDDGDGGDNLPNQTPDTNISDGDGDGDGDGEGYLSLEAAQQHVANEDRVPQTGSRIGHESDDEKLSVGDVEV